MPAFLTIPSDAAFESVRRQLAQQRQTHVVLELPPGWTQLDNQARLRLLQRQAQYQRCQLGLVTQQDSVRKSARNIGIPAFSTREEVPGDRWRMHPSFPLIDAKQPDAGLPEAPAWRRDVIVARAAQPRAHRRRQERIKQEASNRGPLPWWLRLAAYLLMALLMAGLLAAFTLNILPAATVTVKPGREQITVSVPVTADSDAEVSDIQAGIVPGRLVEVTLENSGSLVTSGTQQKPVDKATGFVVFNNLGAAPVDIPRGTVVSTGTGTPVNFRTTDTAQLEGGVGARVSVPIEAEEPGVSGNVRANTINTVNGALRFRVRASNTDATGGGGSQLVSVVTQQDKDALLAQVQAEAETQAFESLQAVLEPDEWLPPESVQVFTIAQAFDKFNDDEGDTVELTLRSLVQGTALKSEDAEGVVLSALQENVPKDAMLVADSIRYDGLSDIASTGRQVVFTMTGGADYVIPIDPVELKNLTAGLPEEEAVAAIQAALAVGSCAGDLPGPNMAAYLAEISQPHPSAHRLWRGGGDAVIDSQSSSTSAHRQTYRRPPPGKLLALDVGLARIGVAVCDPLQLAARPLKVLRRASRRQDFATLAGIVRAEEVNAVICGLPLNMDGSDSDQTHTVRKWAMRLAHALRALLGHPVPIIFWDERLSTFAANEIESSEPAGW